MNDSQRILSKNEKHASKLIKTIGNLTSKSFEDIPKGSWNSVAIIKTNGLTIDNSIVDLEFTIPFDDDLESNEAEVIVYNLADDTINKIKKDEKLTITAGYKEDSGIIFNGYVVKVSTRRDGVDKITTIKCVDDISEKNIVTKSYGAGIKASAILDDLLALTKLPIKVNRKYRDWTYDSSVNIDESLQSAIKKYSKVCGVSTFVSNGSIYCQYIKDFTDINFTVSEETGMIGSPSPYTEEITAEDYTDTIEGYEIQMLLQHRMSAGAGIKLKSKNVNGTFRVRSGEHVYNESQHITTIKVF